jgi:sodium/potassium-transporting ATPase subunit alpha
MIAELLTPAKVIPGLRDDFNNALELLCSRSSVSDLAKRIREQMSAEQKDRYIYVGDSIAVPHVRIENLAAPEIVLGLAPHGLSFNAAKKLRLILLLVTPAEQPVQHLQLLQRIGSLLPSITDELLRQRDPVRVLQTIARAEQQSARPTYINLSQDQIAFELQTDLDRGLASAEARRRLSQYGPNLLRRAYHIPWYFKFVRNFFSFFAVLLWMAALLCFLPAVNLPQLGVAILVVILVNGLFALFQEYKSDRALECCNT